MVSTSGLHHTNTGHTPDQHRSPTPGGQGIGAHRASHCPRDTWDRTPSLPCNGGEGQGEEARLSRGRRDVPPDRTTLPPTLFQSFVAGVSEFGNQEIRSSEGVPECLKLP